jgi:hypothetical protein
LLSARSQQRLIELHRAANAALHDLNQHHSLLLGALLGCDDATRYTMLEGHRARTAIALEALERLGAFLERCRITADAPRQA